MIPAALAILLGVCLLQWGPDLPPAASLLLFPLALWAAWRSPRLRWPLLVCVGYLWAAGHAHWQMRDGLAPELEGRDLVAEGVVASLPGRRERGVRFVFDIERLELDGQPVPNPGRVRLSWHDTKIIPAAGDRWRFTVRLRAPSGLANPGGFDYEGWLFRNGLRATGYLREKGHAERLGEAGPGYTWLRLRQAIRGRIHAAVPDRGLAGLIAALAIGDTDGIEPAAWDLFAVTGTNHLITISGLHIGIFAGLAFALVRRTWAAVPVLALRLPAPQAAALAALIAALLYAALAGFAIPTQRSLIQCSVLFGAILARSPLRPGYGLALALLLVVLWDPAAVLSGGFWLSFVAVAAIFLTLTERSALNRPLHAWGRVQWGVSLGLTPVLVALGFRVSLVAPAVNVIAIPLFSFLVVPGVLLGVALAFLPGPLGGWLLTAMAWTLQFFMDGLARLAELPLAAWQAPALPAWTIACACLGALLLAAPAGLPGRWLGLVWLVPLVAWRPPLPAPGEVWLDVLDVGQGLSAVVRTASHTLVYDTGPRFSADFDAGSGVVAPFLLAQGIDRVDRVILSNGDADHAGGLEGLAAEVRIDERWSGNPADVPGSLPCTAGARWEWDGVAFRVLHPPAGGGWSGNDASCALMVEGAHRLLLTGDVEARAERAMLQQADALHADLAIIPHHGSRTSSLPAFVAAVRPTVAVVSSGWRNRFGLPRADVLARWSGVGAHVLDTARDGAVEVRSAPGQGLSVETQRGRNRRYWSRPLPRPPGPNP